MALLILASELLRLPVVAMDVSARVGKVHDVLIDTGTGRFEGLMISPDWLSRSKFVASDDIISIDPNGIVLKSTDHIVAIEEVVRAHKIWQGKIRLVGHKVVTQAGQRLGKVSDLVISMHTNKVVKFYVAAWFADRVIGWDKVIKIDKKAVVVEDDVALAKTAAATQMERA